MSNARDNTDPRRATSDGEILWAIKGLLDARFPSLGLKLEQLRAQCSEEEQRRIATHPEYERGTIERWAWHAGYVACLGSIVHLIDRQLAEARRARRQERDEQLASSSKH